MKAKKIIIGTALAIVIIIAAGLIVLPMLRKAPPEEKENEIPENGVYYEYSSGGNSDRIISRTIYENSVPVSVDKYEYWITGEIKTVTTTVDGEITNIWSYNFSQSGILDQMVHQFFEDGVEYKDDYRYDEKSNLQIITSYIDKKNNGGTRYFYSDEGLLSKEERFDPNSETVTYTEYTYDDKGNMLESRFYQFQSLSTRKEYSYTDTRLTSVTEYSKDTVLTVENYTYAPDGKLSRISKLNADSTLIGYTECLYDDTGFHYKDIYYENGEPLYCYEYNKDGIPVYKAY